MHVPRLAESLRLGNTFSTLGDIFPHDIEIFVGYGEKTSPSKQSWNGVLQAHPLYRPHASDQTRESNGDFPDLTVMDHAQGYPPALTSPIRIELLGIVILHGSAVEV